MEVANRDVELISKGKQKKPKSNLDKGEMLLRNYWNGPRC